MELLADDIATKEVLEWQGVHLLHFRHSSCSQKTRIFLNLKGINWQSHHLDLAKQKNYEDWFLGINPRGLVPVLVHDGVVHIESNDILTYLDRTFPERPLIPDALKLDIAKGLKQEDDLHLDIRAITMGFLSPKALVTKKTELIENYSKNPGTVQGKADPHKSIEIKFWQDFASTGITEAQAIDAVRHFKDVYQEFDTRLGSQNYLLGNEITLLDIAWYIYSHRLHMSGYPMAQLHSNVWSWFQKLNDKPEFYKEVQSPWPMTAGIKVFQSIQKLKGQSLEDVMERGGLLGVNDGI